jgi:hypothetical protein
LSRRTATELTLAVIVFALTLALRIHGIDRHFWMLGDQIRDWNLALGRFPSAADVLGGGLLVRDETDFTGFGRDGKPHVERRRSADAFVEFVRAQAHGRIVNAN